jgi:hypothetical protein
VRDEISADIAVAAGTIIDNDLLAQRFTQLLSDCAGECIRAPARRKRNDKSNWPVRIRLSGIGGRDLCCPSQRDQCNQ